MMKERLDPQHVDANRERLWKEHLQRWRESGLTQSAYCRQQGLSRHQFKYWRQKLEPSSEAVVATPTSNLIPVEVEPEPSPLIWSLTLPNGAVFHGSTHDHIDMAKRLLFQR